MSDVTKNKDEERSRYFIQFVLSIGKTICPEIADTIKTISEGEIHLPENEDSYFEISLCILGTSLAVLKGYSQVMTVERGENIEKYCEQSFQKDYDLPFDSITKIHSSLHDYQNEFKKSMVNNLNPFGGISQIMLVRCLGENSPKLFVDSNNFHPAILEAIVNTMMSTVTKTLSFWEER